jgi:hypothetical protein
MDQSNLELTESGFIKMPRRPPTEQEKKSTVDNLNSIAQALERNIAHIMGNGRGKKTSEERKAVREEKMMDYCLGQMARGKTWEEAKAMYDSGGGK